MSAVQAGSRCGLRAYWEGARPGPAAHQGFVNNFYRHGLLGKFIGAGHLLARPHGHDPAGAQGKDRADDPRIFNEEPVAPLFEKRHIRWLMDRPASLFGLGIPPSQFDALKGGEKPFSIGDRAARPPRAPGLRLRPQGQLLRLAGLRPPLNAKADRGPLPPYLQPENF